MTSRIKAFKEQPSPLPDAPEAILAILADRPSKITVNGINLALAVNTAKEMGGFILSMTADRAMYGLKLDWSQSNQFTGCDGVGSSTRFVRGVGEGLGRKADALEESQVQSLTPRPFEPEPQADPLASALERIRSGAERNRRDAWLRRRFSGR